MTDDRVNIKVPPEVHAELDADRDMSWPDYLLHLKRLADRETPDDKMGVGEIVEFLERVPERTADEVEARFR